MPGVGSPIVASCLARALSAPPFAVSSLDVIAASPIQPCRCPWNASSWTEPARRPKSIVCPGAQFRKDLRHPQKPSSGRRLRRGQRFFRNWTQGEEAAGATNQPGLPNAKGQWGGGLITARTESGIVFASSLGQANIQGNPSSFLHATIGIDLSRGSDIYGNSDTVMPASINQPAILYLGRPAQV